MAHLTGCEFLSDAPFSNLEILCFSVRSRFTIKCGGGAVAVHGSEFADVTGELSVSYMGVGIKGGSRGGHGPPLSSYHSVP